VALYYDLLQYQQANRDLLTQHFELIRLPNPEHDHSGVLKRIEVVFAPLGYFWGKEKIDLSPNLKIIASNTTGTPHIDVEYAKERGIEVISLKGLTEFLQTITPTAEHTWGLILALTRRTPWAFQSVCQGVWNRRLFGGKAMLSSLSLGVVGLGRLGKMVANYGRCFGMEVRYFDPYVAKAEGGEFSKVATLEELVSLSDVVTIHVPLEEETRNMFTENIFSKFKKGAYLINTSRGEIVDCKVMLKYLKNGILGGCAVDVFTGEFSQDFSTRLKNHPLIQYAKSHDNLLITPHIGGSTIDAWRLTEEHTIQLVLESLGISII